jgi:amino acid transporter
MDISKRVGGPARLLLFSFVLVVAGIASANTGQARASRLRCGLGRDRVLPYRIFGYVHPRLGTPVYSVLLMGIVHLAGALLLQYTEAAELVNFGAFIGFMLVNLCVVRHYWLRLRLRQRGQFFSNLILPILGFAVCFYIWLHLSPFALKLGAIWMGIGFLYLLFLTQGFTRKAELGKW